MINNIKLKSFKSFSDTNINLNLIMSLAPEPLI